MPLVVPFVSAREVDTTGVSKMKRQARFGQEFQGCLANARIVLVFSRAKATARRGAKIIADQAEPSIDDPELSIAEELSKVRVQTPVREYPAAWELQLLGEPCMSDAIEALMDKEDIFSIQKCVPSSPFVYTLFISKLGA